MIKPQRFGAGAGIGFWGPLSLSLLILLSISACSPGNKAAEELVREIQELKKEVRGLQEKLDRLEASQQTLLELLKKPAPPPEAAALPTPPPQEVQPLQTPPAAAPLTVSQLLAKKEQYLGTRVMVRGMAGPIVVHHKSLILRAPEGMVEVFFGKITDQKLVQYLTSATLDKPVTVTGMVGLLPKEGSAKLQINAESIDF